ncbi:hypothetical protein DENSPDRAFT_80744 [Dentipellis sp. KUC8613]|nr:hypothetical protein DENSPDRAFT_80744 [Dentipellis sp. KUC8613]
MSRSHSHSQLNSNVNVKQINVVSVYPDNQDTKEVFLQAAGTHYSGSERHVLLYWTNYIKKPMIVAHITQLLGIPGAYHWENAATLQDYDTFLHHDTYSLGEYSRAQRDRIIELAEHLDFVPTSTVNSCRTWMRDLLDAMVKDPDVALDPDIFSMIDEEVPLLVRRPEEP